MLTTNNLTAQTTRAIYTAFGEPVTYDSGSQSWQVGFPADIGSRYGYDGGWGYESGLLTLWGEDTSLPPVTLQHVGERWYQPGIGRFIQRDPIGLGGGFNVYAYVASSPLMRIDAAGLQAAPHWSDGLPPLSTVTDAAGVGAVGGGLVGISAGTAGPLAALGALSAWLWYGGKAVCIQAMDLVDSVNDLDESEKRNHKQREDNPEVFPPKPPRPINVPEVPCGHPWC